MSGNVEIRAKKGAVGRKGFSRKRIMIAAVALVVVVAIVLVAVLVIVPRFSTTVSVEVKSSEAMGGAVSEGSVSIDKEGFAEKGPQRADIVAFFAVDGADDDAEVRLLIRRVIAVGGQTVEIDKGMLVVDDTYIEEKYLAEGVVTEEADGSEVTYPYVVPEGYVWVMCDNRSDFDDSRSFGAVPVENIVGKVEDRTVE